MVTGNKKGGMNVEFFVFRINKLSILKNREWGRAEVKLLSFVTGQDVNLPDLSGFQRAGDEEKRQLIRAAAQSVLSAKTLIQVENVRDGHIMTFGDTGYALYTADRIPVSFNWSFLAFELDDDIREIGRRLDAVLNDPGFYQGLDLICFYFDEFALNPSHAKVLLKFVQMHPFHVQPCLEPCRRFSISAG